MAEEYAIHFSNAMQEWGTASKNQSMSSFNNAISFMLLAIKKAPEPLEKIHAFFAMIYYEAATCQSQESGRNVEKKVKALIDNALQQANTALEIHPLSFNAQLVKTYVASDNILYMQGGASNLVPKAGFSAAGVTEFLVRAGSMGVAAGKVGVSQAKFKKEAGRLLEIYSEIFTEYYMDASDFIDFTGELFNVADFCSRNQLSGAKEIFSGIANVDLNDLRYEDYSDEEKAAMEAEVVRLHSLAEGRLMML